MTTSLISSLNAATDSLGPEHAASTRAARATLRSAYVNAKRIVTGSTELDPADIVEMDAQDAFVGRWLRDNEGRTRLKQAVDGALAPEQPQ